MADNCRDLYVEHSTSTAHRLLHYDGDCNNVHGHNMKWEVTLTVEMTEADHQMPLDFKDVTGLLDEYDHAILLNQTDPLAHGDHDMLGEVQIFHGDPTCENVGQVVADRFVEEIGPVRSARVGLAETDKYTSVAWSHEYE